MTVLVKDLLIYGNKIFQITTLPLDQYLSGLKVLPTLVPPSTACWRGYIATWELRNKKLILVDLTGYLKGEKKAGIELLFTDQNEVFADWFTGEIRLPEGNGKFNVYDGYNPISKDYQVLTFNNGILTES